MALALATLRCPDHVAPETRTVSGGEYWIGRGPENDWVLPDPERALSKRHCVIAFRSGTWQIADFSTNGTFLNRESEPIGRGQARELRNGDRLCIGTYEIEVRLEATSLGAGPTVAPDPFVQQRSAAPQTFGLDPFAAPAGGRGGPSIGDPLIEQDASADPFAPRPGSAILPPDFDPLAPEPVDRQFRGPTQSDHNQRIEDAFLPPRVQTTLPDDWDRDLASIAPAPAQEMPQAPAPPPVPEPAPVARAAVEPMTRTPQPAAPERLPESPSPPPSAAPRTQAGAPVVAPVPAVQPRASEALLEAFLRGAGLAELNPGDPEQLMETLGAAFRAAVAGLRQAMIARAAVKNEFRIEQTMIRSRGNNPLKFAADDDDALAALLGAGRRSDMSAIEAISDALRDIRLHELATVSAMQTAVRALLAEFEPAKLRQSAEGGLALMAAQRKAYAWDAFEQLHGKVSQALMDDFDSVFGKAFARAYERALAEVSSREPGA